MNVDKKILEMHIKEEEIFKMNMEEVIKLLYESEVILGTEGKESLIKSRRNITKARKYLESKLVENVKIKDKINNLRSLLSKSTGEKCE